MDWVIFVVTIIFKRLGINHTKLSTENLMSIPDDGYKLDT